MITAVSPGLSTQETLDKYLFSETVPLTFSFLSTSSRSAGWWPVPTLAPVPHEARRRRVGGNTWVSSRRSPLCGKRVGRREEEGGGVRGEGWRWGDDARDREGLRRRRGWPAGPSYSIHPHPARRCPPLILAKPLHPLGKVTL